MKNSRRSFLQLAAGIAAVATATGNLAQAGGGLLSSAPSNPSDALAALEAGNLRYTSGQSICDNYGARRAEVAMGQKPFAIVLACADSRVSPEILFDQNLGDVFVVRVAGNTINDELLGSIEYAAEHFASSIIVVVGHERCGAVQAAVAAVNEGATYPKYIQSVVDAVVPAVESVRTHAGDMVDNSVRANAKRTAEQILALSSIVREKVHAGSLQVTSGYYDLDQGKVTWLGTANHG